MKSNSNLGALEVGPFYAIHITPGDLGTEASLLTMNIREY
jgi:hypothetical protein